MRLVGLISGGKDSLYNMLQCIAAGHEIVAVANIEPETKEELDSYMYQSVGHEVMSLIAGALSLPIFRQKTKGKAICQNKTYSQTSQDEVEDLLDLLIKVMKSVPIDGVAVGAIASDYQRTRVENVCSRLGLKTFAYLWRRNQAELLEEMIEADMDAIIIKVACIGLNPKLHLGMHIRDIQPHLLDLQEKYGMNVCGEGGEYETLTLDCPLYNRCISIIDSENIILSDDAFAPVGFFSVKNATLMQKSADNGQASKSIILQDKINKIQSMVKNPYYYVQDCVDAVSETMFPQRPRELSNDLPFPFEEHTAANCSSACLQEYWKQSTKFASKVKFVCNIENVTCKLNYTSGWCCIGNVSGVNISDAMENSQKHLERMNYNFQDVVFINLYVKEMSEFNRINAKYSEFMPEIHPPARACVQTILPPETGVLLNIVAHKLVSKCQKAVNANNCPERESLHVQSVSHWAPANIGPYSQCIKIGGVYFVAGQIPLIPGTMEIINKPIFYQCKLSLRHVLRILQAMNENLSYSNILQAICYVTSQEVASDIFSLWKYITKATHTAVAIVVVTRLPKKAQLEWEVMACHYNDPSVKRQNEIIEEFSIEIKQCVYMEPFTSSLVCKVYPYRAFSKKSQGKIEEKSLKFVTSKGLSSVLQHCINFIKKDWTAGGVPLIMLKLFYKASETAVAMILRDVIQSLGDVKVVTTVIPVVACEDPEVFLTIAGVCF